MESIEYHRNLKLDHEARHRLFSASVSILDRLLNSSGRPRARAGGVDGGSPWDAKFQFVVTAGWDRPPPVFLEFDMVAHCGGSLVGSLSHRLAATDVCTGWTEALSTSGQGTVPGGLRSGSHWTADTSSDKGNRLGQRQCLHQPEADTVVRGTRNRVHTFLGLLQERPGLNRGEQRGLWGATLWGITATPVGCLDGRTGVHVYRTVRA